MLKEEGYTPSLLSLDFLFSASSICCLPIPNNHLRNERRTAINVFLVVVFMGRYMLINSTIKVRKKVFKECQHIIKEFWVCNRCSDISVHTIKDTKIVV